MSHTNKVGVVKELFLAADQMRINVFHRPSTASESVRQPANFKVVRSDDPR